MFIVVVTCKIKIFKDESFGLRQLIFVSIELIVKVVGQLIEDRLFYK